MRLTVRQTEEAKGLWKQGLTLGEIADKLSCSIYDLSPWIYADDLDKILEENGIHD